MYILYIYNYIYIIINDTYIYINKNKLSKLFSFLAQLTLKYLSNISIETLKRIYKSEK